jgi:hypothetical protein
LCFFKAASAASASSRGDPAVGKSIAPPPIRLLVIRSPCDDDGEIGPEEEEAVDMTVGEDMS